MPEFVHQSVLLREVLQALEPRSGQLLLDGTLGGAGHSYAWLKASSPNGTLIGLDRDEIALRAATERLQEFAGRFHLHRGNFANMDSFTGPETCDAVLLDLGVSSPQLDIAERGFSFQREGPLDMRMDARDAVTAADIVNTWPEEELANLFWELGEERASRRIANTIAKRRVVRKFETTTDLAELIATSIGRGKQKIHPATKVFQALRMEVNRELDALEDGLNAAWQILKPQGRLGVITFHSLEDRIVKNFGRELEREYSVDGEVDIPELRKPKVPEARWITRKPFVASEDEVRQNPRARSAKLRVLEKLEVA
ncbi:MAG TPA: 16S rRNA (cytosine(1402)-N(4))-methyltransferase RsmH [Candidatus Kapabacteria bacterium]|nr:16S rRNA (cytosine(1402)-N(4))-methyltransferase RsmH [Candidatus Kapabacteria bacterium]